MFAAAAFLPLSDATAISFLNPVVGMALAVLFLGEKVGRERISAALIALFGAMVLRARRPTRSSRRRCSRWGLRSASGPSWWSVRG